MIPLIKYIFILNICMLYNCSVQLQCITVVYNCHIMTELFSFYITRD